MALSRKRKEELVTQYNELIGESNAIFFTEYRGLTNKQLTAARRKIREAEGVYNIAKLTLFRIAMQEQGYEMPDDLAGRPIGITYAMGEIPRAAKAVTDVADDNEVFSVVGGIVGGNYVSAADVKAIANLPPLDVLRAQLLGTITAPSSQLVGVVQAGVSSIVNVLHAYVEKGEGEAAAD